MDFTVDDEGRSWYMDGYRVFTWDRELFPDSAGMLERLTEQGFRVVTTIDPVVKYEPGYAIFDAGRERDVFCRTEGGDTCLGQVWPGTTAFPDFVTEEARTWWGELNAAHVQSGLAGIWNDMNEPAIGRIPAGAMRFGHGRFSHERYHNQYALLMAMGTTQGLLDAMPDLRTFVLSRAGFAGIQRYAANRMGDHLSRWDHRQLSLPRAAGGPSGMSGQAFVGADMGGFAGDCDAELFLRWMQLGVLTPFCRNHNMLNQVDQYVWSRGPVVEDLVRATLELRYRLLPYLYSAFLTASETGAPVQRPLVFDFQYEPTVAGLDGQYLFGPHLLVAPVTEPGMTSRRVYLPAGSWYDWWTDELLEGGRFLTAATPMEHILLYARGGAVIPVWAEAPPSTPGYAPAEVELHLFVSAEDGATTSTLSEDDGVSFAADRGARVRAVFTVAREGDRLTLTAEVTGGGYPEFAREAFVLVLHGARPDRVLLDGTEAPVEAGRLRLPNAGTGFAVELSLAGGAA